MPHYNDPKIMRSDRTEEDRLMNMLRFCEERERIHRRKKTDAAGPWTTDSILRVGHFCNVRRADDRVTMWIGDWLPKNPKIRWFACAMARWFNEPDTLRPLRRTMAGPVWKESETLAILRDRSRQGFKIFNAAYIISGAIAKKRRTKWEAVVKDVLSPLYKEKPIIVNDSIQESWQNLLAYPGMGSFMAGQIVADWQTFDVIHGRDVHTWAPLGPGSNRGLRYIFGKEDGKYSQNEAVVLIQKVANFLESHSEMLNGMNLTLHDYQNCLCEFSKYVKGGSKRKYVPHVE